MRAECDMDMIGYLIYYIVVHVLQYRTHVNHPRNIRIHAYRSERFADDTQALSTIQQYTCIGIVCRCTLERKKKLKK